MLSCVTPTMRSVKEVAGLLVLLCLTKDTLKTREVCNHTATGCCGSQSPEIKRNPRMSRHWRTALHGAWILCEATIIFLRASFWQISNWLSNSTLRMVVDFKCIFEVGDVCQELPWGWQGRGRHRPKQKWRCPPVSAIQESPDQKRHPPWMCVSQNKEIHH